MKPIESPPLSTPRSEPVARKAAAKPKQAQEIPPTEEQAFYAAQEEAFSDLRAYHANRPRRKR